MSISPHDRKNLKFGKRGLAAGFACSEAGIPAMCRNREQYEFAFAKEKSVIIEY